MLSNLANDEFPWDSLLTIRRIASQFNESTGQKVIDLSIGAPIDDVPQSVQTALSNSANSPSYPQTIGSIELRNAICSFLNHNQKNQEVLEKNIIPTVGSKEAIALLPQMLGIKEGDIIVRPRIAYPTYDVSAHSVGATILATDNIEEWSDPKIADRVKLVWINSPNNPTGEVKSDDYLKRVVETARQIGAIVASDECYSFFNFDTSNHQSAPSILNRNVCGGSLNGILQFYSLSKQMNLAGYRSAFISGDENIISKLRLIRKQIGLIIPEPIQQASVAALNDSESTKSQFEKYLNRRKILLAAIENANLNSNVAQQQNLWKVEHSTGGIYLWIHVQNDCFDELKKLAQIGIIAAPGIFYSSECSDYIRVGLTANDDDIAEAAARITDYLGK